MNRLVICSHGTRSEVGAARITALVGAVADALPSVEVREAHVDVHPPYVEDVLTQGSVVVPLLLAPGYHVETDIAGAAARHGARVTPALGPDGLLTALLASRLRALSSPLGRDDLVVLAAAGSSVAGSARATREVAHQLSVRLGRPVHVGYGAASPPRLQDLVAGLRESRSGRRVVAASYLLAPGHFHELVLSSGADAVTEPLMDGGAPDPRLVELVVRRYLDGGLAGVNRPGRHRSRGQRHGVARVCQGGRLDHRGAGGLTVPAVWCGLPILWPQRADGRELMIKAATTLDITGGILVGHDGSPAAADSVRWAARLAAKLGTPLHVVRCWSISTAPRPATATDGYVPPLTDFEAAVHDRLKADIAQLGLDVAPTCHVLHGPAGRRLLEASELADMLVIGTRGAGGFLGLHLGSTADQVVRHARCPVIVVPVDGNDDPPDLDTQLAD